MTTERLRKFTVARFGVEEFVSDNVVIVRNVLEGEAHRRTMEILKLRGTTHMKGDLLLLSLRLMTALIFSHWERCD